MDKRVAKQTKRLQEVWDQICETRATYFVGEGYRKLIHRLKLPERLIRAAIKTHGTGRVGKRSSQATTKPPRRIPNLIKLITQALVDDPAKIKRGNWILRQGINKYRHIIEPTRPYQLCAGDWKEIRLPMIGITIYLFVIIDCYSRQVMGFELSLTKDENTAIRVSNNAYQKATQDPLFDPQKLIMHTDQGSAYVSEKYIRWWRVLGVKLSTADKGKPTQNPYIEAFFSLTRRFHLDAVELLTIAEVNQSISDFIDRYNREWLHSKLDYQSPNQMLESYRLSLKSD